MFRKLFYSEFPMSSILFSRFGVSLVPFDSGLAESGRFADKRMSFKKMIPFFQESKLGLQRAASDDSLLSLTDRSIAVLSPSNAKLSKGCHPSPIPRPTSPVTLKYVQEQNDVRPEHNSSLDAEEAHASNFLRKVISDLEIGRIFPAIMSASMISLSSERIFSECAIFEKVYDIAKTYSEGSKEFIKYEKIAWEALNRAFDFLEKGKKELNPDVYNEVMEILCRYAARS
jgi:hypothetical protein